VKYFAYGSNLCSRRLRARTPSAVVVAVSKLQAHVLRFHKAGFRDGSGEGNAFETGTATDVIWGAVYEIATAEKPQLDHAEGLGSGYVDRMVGVESTD
jgi:gamma-glutamylcyclotransferase